MWLWGLFTMFLNSIQALTHLKLEGISLLHETNDGEVVQSSEGLLVVKFSRDQGELINGTVCSLDFTFWKAIVSCRFMGYDSGVWTSDYQHRNKTLGKGFITTHLHDVQCLEDPEVSLSDCGDAFVETNCSFEARARLSCFSNPSDLWTSYNFSTSPILPVSLKSSYLHFTTSYPPSDGGRVEISFFNSSETLVSGISVIFKDPNKFLLASCMRPRFPKELPTDNLPMGAGRVWSVVKRGYRITLYCNGRVVLDAEVSDEMCTNAGSTWDEKWRSPVKTITFSTPRNNRQPVYFYFEPIWQLEKVELESFKGLGSIPILVLYNKVDGVRLKGAINKDTALKPIPLKLPDDICKHFGFESGGTIEPPVDDNVRIWFDSTTDPIQLNWIDCDDHASSIHQCSYGVDDVKCDFDDALWLSCRAYYPHITLHNGKTTGSSQGLLLFEHLNNPSVQENNSVCAWQFNWWLAQRFCRHLGYEVGKWGTSKQFGNLTEDWPSTNNVVPSKIDLECPPDNTTLEACKLSLKEGNCTVNDSVWLNCYQDSSGLWTKYEFPEADTDVLNLIPIVMESSTLFLKLENMPTESRIFKLEIYFKDYYNQEAGGILFLFRSKVSYKLLNCMADSVNLDPPLREGGGVWSVSKQGRWIEVYYEGKIYLSTTVSVELCRSPDYNVSWAEHWDRQVDGVVFIRSGKNNNLTLLYDIEYIPSWEFETLDLVEGDYHVPGTLHRTGSMYLPIFTLVSSITREKATTTTCTNKGLDSWVAGQICQGSGFQSGSWGYGPDNSRNQTRSWLKDQSGEVKVVGIQCPNNSQSLSDCYFMFREEQCNQSVVSWIHCNNSSIGVSLITDDKETNTEGLLQLQWTKTMTGRVCSRNMDWWKANIICRHLGHEAAKWGSYPRNMELAPHQLMETKAVEIQVLHCQERAMTLSRCDVIVREDSCAYNQSVWVTCLNHTDVWTPRTTQVQWQFLDHNTLHYQTSASLFTNERLIIHFKDLALNRMAGGMIITYNQTPVPTYRLNMCGNDTEFPVPLPQSGCGVWTVVKRGYRVVLLCEGRMVVNVTASDDTCIDPKHNDTWDTLKWSKTVNRFYTPRKSLLNEAFYIEPAWSFTRAELINLQSDNDSYNRSNSDFNKASEIEGVLKVTYTNKNTGEQISGTVCRLEFYWMSAMLACQSMGFQFGEVGRVPLLQDSAWQELTSLPIIMNKVRCNSENRDLGGCDAMILGDNCDSKRNVVWLRCSQHRESSGEEWSNDGTCGGQTTPHPSLVGCNPHGPTPCCGDNGSCTSSPCSCVECLDYSTRWRRPSASCTLAKLEGFIKTVCYDVERERYYFVCPYSNQEYFHYDGYDSDNKTQVLFGVSEVCQDDQFTFQACGLTLSSTNFSSVDSFCGGHFVKEGNNFYNFTTETNGSVLTSEGSGDLEDPNTCDDHCDDEKNCQDESDCNGYFYGINCLKPRNDGTITYVAIYKVCMNMEESNCFLEDDFRDCAVNESEPAVTGCTHYNRYEWKEERIRVRIHNYTRCGIFDLPSRNFPYCLSFLDQTNCTDPLRVGGSCQIYSHFSTVSKYMVCDSPVHKFVPESVQLCDDGLEKQCSSPSLVTICSVHKHRWCDQVSHCPDGSDEHHDDCSSMTKKRCVRGFGDGRSLPIPIAWIMDNQTDCLSGIDEIEDEWEFCGDKDDGTHRINFLSAPCENVFKCPKEGFSGNQFVLLDLLCDGLVSCDAESKVCAISRGFPKKKTIAVIRNGVRDICYTLFENTSNCLVRRFNGVESDTFGVSSIVRVPSEKVDCTELFGEPYVYLSCLGLCHDTPCPLEDQSPLKHDSCPGQYPERALTLANRSYLTFATEQTTGVYENDYFQCRNKKCVKFSQVCDLVNDCGDMSDEDGKICTNQMVCESTRNSSKQLIALSQKCDGIYDCFDLSDECNETCGKEILEGLSMKVVCWVFGILSILFNSIMVVQACVSLKACRTSSMLCTQSLVGLIGLGDLLIGVYLVVLSVYDSYVYGSNFCEKQDVWLSGGVCMMLGIISTTASQLSLFAMTTLSFIRMLGISSNSLSAPSPVNKRAVLKTSLLVLSVVVASLGVATLPLVPQLEDFFVQAMHYNSSYKVFVGFPNKAKHVEVLQAYYNDTSITTKFSWQHISQLVDQMFTTKYGSLTRSAVHFYGNDGVCLFKYFVRTDDPSRSRDGVTAVGNDNNMKNNVVVWTMLTTNLICFVMISISYVVIARTAEVSSVKAGQNRNREIVQQNRILQRKVLVIIATDFLCWVPFIFISAFHNLELIDATDWYAGFAMTVLPLNSVINPLLYDHTILNLVMRGRWLTTGNRIISYVKRSFRSGKMITEVISLDTLSLEGKNSKQMYAATSSNC